MTDSYSENYKTLMKEIEDNTKKWKDIPCSWTGRTNIVKMSTLPKALCIFNAILIKIPTAFFTKLEQTILKFVQNPNSQSNLGGGEVSKAGGMTIPDCKSYNKAVVIKTVRYWHNNKHTDQ